MASFNTLYEVSFTFLFHQEAAADVSRTSMSWTSCVHLRCLVNSNLDHPLTLEYELRSRPFQRLEAAYWTKFIS
ncbi:hypothetical protein RRG08_057766 [Elysia crispata]|uniref:Uncharacterized protein n=1 Tax=Elysia crispata TaxID=231223 RepID=A0AAE0Y768_9GAST|nr:hypothetical protein RRG08_057766 [Elysia crispata]